MAKTAKLKNSNKCKISAPRESVHSRAAKRASSPSINLDKSLKDVKPPSTVSASHPSILSVHNGAGIVKRKGKGKSLSRQQRLRQEKGMERAEAVMDKKEKKVERSAIKGKAVKERSAAWDDLNGKIHDKRVKPKPKEEDEEDWEDEEMQVEDEVDNPIAGTPAIQSLGHIQPPANPPDSEDEIL
ncbi:hypothetical protein MMC17_009680 [Xylographa soralifera]|nr:hypothetical protein [Xylographa soralifera]